MRAACRSWAGRGINDLSCRLQRKCDGTETRFFSRLKILQKTAGRGRRQAACPQGQSSSPNTKPLLHRKGSSASSQAGRVRGRRGGGTVEAAEHAVRAACRGRAGRGISDISPRSQRKRCPPWIKLRLRGAALARLGILLQRPKTKKASARRRRSFRAGIALPPITATRPGPGPAARAAPRPLRQGPKRSRGLPAGPLKQDPKTTALPPARLPGRAKSSSSLPAGQLRQPTLPPRALPPGCRAMPARRSPARPAHPIPQRSEFALAASGCMMSRSAGGGTCIRVRSESAGLGDGRPRFPAARLGRLSHRPARAATGSAGPVTGRSRRRRWARCKIPCCRPTARPRLPPPRPRARAREPE